MSETLRATIDHYWESRATLSATDCPTELLAALDSALAGLDSGELRVATKVDSEWQVQQWLKKAVLLYFRTHNNEVLPGRPSNYYDKVSLKYANWTEDQFAAHGARVVPPATVRHGAYIAAGVVLMPSYVNIGAYVDSGTMIDTWATIGSCAQIGKNVHISGGVGIGGVLEPLQGAPTIIEDDCFIGARSEIVEGVIVERGAVLSMGVYIGASTRIFNRQTGEITYGRVPAGSVVVPGSLPDKKGECSLYCAVIVKTVDAQTRAKTAINELLRD